MAAASDHPSRQRYDDLPMSQGDTGPGMRKDLLSLNTRDGACVDAALYRPGQAMPATGMVWIHPQVSFLHHYALPHFARCGYAALAVNSRYLGNESGGILENVVLDFAAGVDWLRENGCRHIVLVGNSGGGAIACMHQSHAETRTLPDLAAFALASADALVLLNAHRGRAQVFTTWLDPSVTDERDLEATDPALDMYDARNGPPYSTEWLAAYREAQITRNRRITRWVEDELARLSRLDGPVRDFPFVVYRTAADPRFLDLAIDPSDRAAGTYWGDARAANYMLGGLGRITSLRSWLSQWGYDTSRGSAVEHLRRVSTPVLVLQSTADQGVFPSEAKALHDAAATGDKRLMWLAGATHFFKDQPERLQEMVSTVAEWLSERGF
jgi:pimeloyl-ACP methyl ester carboxylesterase